MNNDDRDIDDNRDPISGEPGAHAVGTGPEALVGGTAADAVVGGLAGQGVEEVIDPAREHAYWSENFGGRDYIEQGSSFDDYGPAYGFGVNARGLYPGRDFDDVESEMSVDWNASRGASNLRWDRAKHAARDAWNRISPTR